MIYTGSDEIRGVMLGNDEIPAIYVGSEQIYPMTISGFTVRPQSLSFSVNGGSKNIRIVSEYDWTAVSDNTAFTLSAASGSSGRTSITVTAGPNQTGDVISGTVVVTSTDLQHSATVDVEQGVEYEPTGYLEFNGNARVSTQFNPYNTYVGGNNYMRIELQADVRGGYLWNASIYPNWFSFEHSGSIEYQNLGLTTFCGGDNWGTSGTSSTAIFTYDNGTWTMQKGNQIITNIWEGDFPNNSLVLFSDSYPRGDFYRLKVFNSPSGGPVYDFCPALDGNNTACIFESINETYHYPTAGSGITFVSF